jgi:hypothetical protein
MIPAKNKKAAKSLSRHFRRDWGDLAEFLDTVSLEAFRGAPNNCAAYTLGKRLRAVADFARDPYAKDKPINK